MKDKRTLEGYIKLVIVLVASIASIFIFGNMDISLIVNVFFSLLMFIILLKTMGSIRRFVSLINSIKMGTEYINSVDQSELVETKDGYNIFPANEKLYKALTTYFKENSEYDGDIADYITEIEYLIQAISDDGVIPEYFEEMYNTFKKVVKF